MAKSSIFIIPDVTRGETLSGSPSVSFDAVTNFSPTRGRNITKSPVSGGSFISEYLSDNGGKVVMEAYVSNNPVIINQNNLINSNDPDGRAQAAYLALDTLYKSKDTVTIKYRFDSLNSYFLTNFEPILMPSDTIGFRLEFDEVRFASEQRVALIVNMSDEKAREAGKEQNTAFNAKEVASSNEVSFVETYLPFLSGTPLASTIDETISDF